MGDSLRQVVENSGRTYVDASLSPEGWLHAACDVAIVGAGLGFALALTIFHRRRGDLPFPRFLRLLTLFVALLACAHAFRAYVVPSVLTAIASWGVLAMLLRTLATGATVNVPATLTEERARWRYRHFFEHGAVSLCELDLSEVRRVVTEVLGRGVDDVHRYAEEHPEFVRQAISSIRVVEASHQWLETYGVGPGSPTDGALDRIVFPETLEDLPALLEAVARADCTVRIQTVLRHVSGDRLNVAVTARLPSQEGPWNRILMTFHDTTEYTLAEERFRLTVEGAPTAMILTDSEGCIVLVNSQAESLFGWPRSELLGRPVEVLVPGPYRSAHPKLRRSFLKDATPRAMGAGRELFGVRRDGREIPIEIGLNPLRTQEGIFVLSSIIDITERQRSEERIRLYSQQLERTNKDLEASNRELEDFVHVASHDLQEPLRKITAFAGLLVRDAGDGLNEKARRDLDFVADAAERMRRLVRDLLMLSRAGRAPLRVRSLELDSVLDEATRRVSVSLDEAQGTIERQDLPTVRGDRTLLTELFQNLLSNAVKFRHESRPLHVEVTVENCGPDAVFGVKDNGIGIEREYRERIFAPFHGLHSRDRYQGTGVGLAICRHAVGRHGGQIWVEAAEGGGAHFRFTLPGVDESPEVDGPRPEDDRVRPLVTDASPGSE